MFCKNCGKRVEYEETVCQRCGSPIKENETTKEKIEGRITTTKKGFTILSIILPIIGLGLIFTIGIPYLIAIIMIIIGIASAKKGEIKESGVAKIGKILNYIFLIVVVLTLFINGMKYL